MKQALLILSSLLLFGSLFAQNLVHNPSFEQSTSCPTDTGQIAFASEWFSAGAGADYFDSCAANYLVSTPLNYMGYQQAYSNGHAYAGFYFYKQYAVDSHGYICGNIDPLVPGHWYRIMIHLCGTRNTKYRSHGPQAFFYINGVIPATQLLQFTPQVDFNSFIAEDTTTWTTPNTIFYADSGYTKIIIGNFKDDAHSLISMKYPPSWSANARDAAYGYLDSISVTDITVTYIAGLETEPVNVSAYPNPFTSYTNINIDAGPHEPYTLRLYNLQGAMQREINDIKSNNIVLQRDGLPSGFYYYRILDQAATVATGKLLVQ